MMIIIAYKFYINIKIYKLLFYVHFIEASRTFKLLFTQYLNVKLKNQIDYLINIMI